MFSESYHACESWRDSSCKGGRRKRARRSDRIAAKEKRYRIWYLYFFALTADFTYFA